MYLLISYDIANNRQRAKIADELLNYGLQRVQKSVFEGAIEDARFPELKTTLQKYVKKNDSIRYYVLCQTCQIKIQVSGYDPLPRSNTKTRFI